MSDNYDFEQIKVTLNDRVLDLLMNRPEKRNAISRKMEDEINECLSRAERDSDVGAVMLRGAGPHFTAGHDLTESAAARATMQFHPSGTDRFGRPNEIPRMLPAWYFRKPLIAAIQGFCGPFGTYLAACTDFNIATPDARFDLAAFRRHGGGAPSWHSVTFYQQFPMRVVEKLTLMGGWLAADQALQFQFIQRIVPRDKLEDEARRWARYCSRLPNFEAGKEQIRRVYEIMGLAWMQVLQPRTLDPRRDADNSPFWGQVREKGLIQTNKELDKEFDDDVARV